MVMATKARERETNTLHRIRSITALCRVPTERTDGTALVGEGECTLDDGNLYAQMRR